jgi:hypothetical protein
VTETAPEPIVLIADLFPGSIQVTELGTRPIGIPPRAKLHIILSTKRVAVAWDSGTIEGVPQIGTWSAELTEEQTANADHMGGVVGPYTIARAGGCSCGKALKRWNPYAGQATTQVIRHTTSASYGLPQRYSRS